jgi:alpha-tubulin suppressor-like RCC1 family protein
MPTSRRTRTLALLAVVGLCGAVLVGCRDARLGRRCNTKELGQDHDLVLTCRDGRWRRLMTTREAFFALAHIKQIQDAEAAAARTTTTSPPTTAGPTTTTSTTTTSIPTPDHPAPASAVGAGFGGACALVDGGFVECWGANGNGQLGNGVSLASLTHSSTPVVVDVQDATDLHVGAVHACALVAGAVECWGGGGAGQLGNATTGFSNLPVAVKDLTGVTALGTGMGDTCAVVAGGGVWCWGDNDHGQLGDGTTDDSNVPVQVTGLTDAVDVSSSLGGHSCALRLGGEVSCWGRNQFGELGRGDAGDDVLAPVDVTGLTDAATISVGNYSACSARTDGTVACWGDNTKGQLGDGTTTEGDTFVSVQGVTDAEQVAVGARFACALVGVTPGSGGSVVCWGENTDGQLGDGTTDDSPTPVAVSGVTTAVSIAAGNDGACAVLADGSVTCWGANASGQLGDGTTNPSGTPVAVVGIP